MTTLPNGIELRPIPCSPSPDYMAGSDGQVYSRKKYKGFGKSETVPWYPLMGSVTAKGYVNISMSHQNRRVTKSVHRLVCMAFHGEPRRGQEVRHLDGNPGNNAPSNLAWGTQMEQWQDRRTHGTATVGEKHPAAKFTNKEREHIRWAVSRGLCSQRHASRVLGVTQSSIQSICAAENFSG